MKRNTKILLITIDLSALLISAYWWYNTRDLEPTVVFLGLLGGLITLILKKSKEDTIDIENIEFEEEDNKLGVLSTNFESYDSNNSFDMETLKNIKPMINILFIDDDNKFKVVKILKASGWINTKLVKDIKTLNETTLMNAHIVFVDVQGVGKQLDFKDEGLGLASAIKEKYADKKVIIYSAEPKGDRFHKALRQADDMLEKNAEPYEFESVIEQMTNKLYNDGALHVN